jgi:acyl-coenzyme A synthetase/AMP-(fatty) acid ligase
MPANDQASLSGALSAAGDLGDRWLWGATASVRLGDLAAGTCLGGAREALRGRSVLLTTGEQLVAALALIELDGIARRLVLCPTGLPSDHLRAIATAAEAEFIVSDAAAPHEALPGVGRVVAATSTLAPAPVAPGGERATEWILLTSGTTGVPKLVVHDLASLAGPIRATAGLGRAAVWSTFYDIRRYGGLQMFLRAVLGGGSLVLSSVEEATGDFLARAGSHAVTHISGTPTHWRRALMSPAAARIVPRYVRLSGEIADQAILDQLRAFYRPDGIGHAFASTEAGVAFEVNDGLAGFPATLIDRPGGAVELKIADGSLRIRSRRTASRYLGSAGTLADDDGFVDTGDMIERRGERCYFVGRRDGVVNVGGLKVHPEEVEAVINRHPEVRIALVKARCSPITGAVVAADIVLRSPADGADPARKEVLRGEILELCRRELAPHKVPVTVTFVAALEVGGAGKLRRADA